MSATGTPTPATQRSEAEAARRAALARYEILDTPPEDVFDDVARLASQICGTPVALVSLVDDERQWFKAEVGAGMQETPRSMSICSVVMGEGEVVVLPDLTADSRFLDNPLVTGERHVRFYAGAPLLSHDGAPFGTVCVLDTEPRPDGLRPEQRSALAALGRQVTGHLEARRSAARLREAERRLNAVLDNASVAIFLMDERQQCSYMNAAAERLTGYTLSQTTGRTLHEVVHHTRPDGSHFPIEDCAIDRAFPENANMRGEEVFVRPDGAFYPVRFTASPIRDDSSRTVGTIVEVQDISEERATAAALEASELRFRGVADCIDQMVWATQPDGFHDYYNERWYAFTGVPEGSTDGEAWNGMFHPDDRDRAWESWRRSLATGEPYRIEYRLRHRSGAYRWVLGRAQAVRDTEGRILRWYGTCTDIQEIVEAREVLARSAQDLARLVEERTADRDRLWSMIPDLLMKGTLDGEILAANPAWGEVLGYDEETLRSRPFWTIIHPDSLAASAAAVAQMQAGRVARHQNRVMTTGGDWRWFDWVSAPVGGSFFAVARDITAEREAAAALERVQEALRQSQKMEAVGQLTGGIAHDFNNMLAIVIGSLDLLSRRLGDADERARRHVASAMEGARRAATLTQRLLAFSRQQPLSPEPVDANKLVSGMSELLRRALGEPIRLETVLAGGLWRTHVDPHGLENAILNLAVNARDAMAGGGRLTVETQNAHLDERYAARHLGVPHGQYVLVAVTDTGTGMTPETLARAFDPFFTTKEVGKGTGLGLSMVYGFVKQSGGHVKIYSEPGQGTTLKLYLPRFAGADDGEAQGVADGAPLPTGEREIVLVVEDEEAVRRVSVDALRELGYEVLEADGAAQALRILEVTPGVALLFTDVVMPGMNGRELADRARALRPGLPVLFTTGYTRNAVVHNGVLDAGVDLVGKPFTVEELARKVREAIERPQRRAP